MTVGELILKLEAFDATLPIALVDDYAGGNLVPPTEQTFVEYDDFLGAVLICCDTNPFTAPATNLG